MKVKNIIILIFLLLPLTMTAKNVVWTDGSQVTYSTQRRYDPVVDKALAMFASDMQAVMGRRAKAKSDGRIQVWQLDRMSNKEFRTLDGLRVPYTKVIAKEDAFWIGVRGGKVIVVGSNGRGTAYGILELSRQAGVTPWIWWGDMVPEQRQQLTMDETFETLQAPSVDVRGLALSDVRYRMNYHRLFELLLRLRANALWPMPEEDQDLSHAVRVAADSFAISLGPVKKDATEHSYFEDDGYGYLLPRHDARHEKQGAPCGLYYHLSYNGEPQPYLWLTTMQPGLIAHQLREAYRRGATRFWIINVHDPKVACYPLSLCMDMAWDVRSVQPGATSQHLLQWLAAAFGNDVARRLLQPMRAFYQLTAIRHPEFMAGMETEFSADEFGNELEYYLKRFRSVEGQVAATASYLRPELRDAYFAAVLYPVNAAVAMATKHLQAQEARAIARGGNFHKDDEALESAVKSWLAYEDIKKSTDYYNKVLADGKWRGTMDMAPGGLAVFGPPQLPDKLTAEELARYANADDVPSRLDVDNCIVRQGAQLDAASGGTMVSGRPQGGVEVIDMLGHSMQAVVIPRGDSVVFRFESRSREAVLRTAFIPVHALGDNGDGYRGKSQRVAISIDGGTPFIHDLHEARLSPRWRVNVLRGQAVRSDDIRIPAGRHTLTIIALDDGVILDQWMIDDDEDRQFYVFPIQ